MKTNTVRNEGTGRGILRLEALVVLAACLAAAIELERTAPEADEA